MRTNKQNTITKTYSFTILRKIDLIRGSFTIALLASIISFAWATYDILSKTPADRYAFYEIRFNEEEELACKNEIMEKCRPDIARKIQSNPYSIGNEPLYINEHRLLEWHKKKLYYIDTQTIMYEYKYHTNRNDGYVFKFQIPQYGPRQGKVSAPMEIEPYIQNAINRCIDSHDYQDFTNGGIIGKSEKIKGVYEDYYLAPSKWNQYLEIAENFLFATCVSALISFFTFAGLITAIPFIFVTLAILESITKFVIMSFMPRNRQNTKSIYREEP
jgi:hypothetical protein